MALELSFRQEVPPHAHCIIWVKDAPKYGENSNEEVCDFIDRYVACSIPVEDGKLRDLVLLLQP